MPGYQGQAVHRERLPERRARYGSLDRPLPPALDAALRQGGMARLYSHQAKAVNAARNGQHVVLSTGTSSGKTLAYNIPVLEAIISGQSASERVTALYLFPTKALAQDQLRGLRELSRGMVESRCIGAYDGDTSRGARARLRREANILITNPDMLHLGILPNHTLWADFFAGLRFVVVDEAHAYRGVFGSHVGCVLRRMWRVCARYGAAPQIIACSATIANPGEHVRRLAGVEAQVVDDEENGAPRGTRDFVLWNPPLVDRAKATRRSANIEAARLFARLVQSGIRTIAFTRARRLAELILLYARRILEDEARPSPAGGVPHADRVRAYRAGYRPEERRAIERELRPGGNLLGVIATSALELGIDIGDLDASLLVGYPGTIASLWQQAGRAGRGTRRALSVLIALDNPLDQYFVRNPKDLFGRPHEHALIDPSNPYILEQHLPCAAHEFPLSTGSDEPERLPPPVARLARRALPGRRRAAGASRPLARIPAGAAAGTAPMAKSPLPPGLERGDDEALFGPGFVPAMIGLEDEGGLEFRRDHSGLGRDRWFPRAGAYPAQDVSLRALAGSRVALLHATQNYRLLEVIGGTSALHRVHPGAIYLHQGESFLVRELDLDIGHAILEPVRVDYYTQPREVNNVQVIRAVERRQVGESLACLGEVRVTQQVIGYRRLSLEADRLQFHEETLSIEDLDLPVQTFDTIAVWWDVPRQILARAGTRRLDPAGGLHAVEHAAIGLLPLFAMCDRWDIGGLSTPRHPDTGEAQVFIYDGFPGGVGIAEKGFDLLLDLWRATHDAVRDCPCEDGCPSCVQVSINNRQTPEHKGVVLTGRLVLGR